MKSSKLYDWKIIQEEYNLGMSQRDILRKYKMSSLTLHTATKNGDLACRSRSEAASLDHAKKPPRSHTEEFKQRQRANINKRYKDGWMPKAGRCKKYTYVSPIAGTVHLDGTWELAVAEWLDVRQYNWKRNTSRFQYVHLNGKNSFYIPDFWVEEFNGYLEVKGYETALDRCKWSQFPDQLTVWKEKELKELKIL